jgi:hypothetical protein
MTQAVERITIVILLALVATPAYAGRWRKGPRPAGTTYTQRQTVDGRWCHYRTDETGTNECRWKNNWGCKWSYDAGVNQCSPTPSTPTPTAAATLTAANGSLTITPIEDGDSKPETMSATLAVKKATTGEIVTAKIRFRVSSTDSREITTLSQGSVAVKPRDYIALGPILGTSTYRPITLTADGGGVRIGGAPAPVPIPGAPVPPGGYTCGVAWSDYVAKQLNCFGDQFGQASWQSFIDGSYAAYRSGWKCGVMGYATENLAVFASCLAMAGGEAFVYNFVENLFGPTLPVTANCNGIAQARVQTSQYCSPTW